MKSSRFKARFYKKELFYFENHKPRIKKNRDGTLFSGHCKTKIIPAMLPEWYVYGRYYKLWGYMSVKGITDMKYIPNRHTNHYLKDDCLLISYGDKIVEIENGRGAICERFAGYHESVWGGEIIDILKGAREYSNYDIAPIIEQLKEKKEWLKNAYPDEFGGDKWDFDVDECFNKSFENKKDDFVYAINIMDKRFYGSMHELTAYIEILESENDSGIFTPYINAFKESDYGNKEVLVETSMGSKPILEKLIEISIGYVSVGIYDSDPQVPLTYIGDKKLDMDKIFMWEKIIIENGQYIRLIKPETENLRYSGEQPIIELPKDNCYLTYIIDNDGKVRIASTLYVAEKRYASAKDLNADTGLPEYDMLPFIKEIL